jgi:ABC-type amino acid transport substrate-binding protein
VAVATLGRTWRPYFDANQGFLIKKGGPGEGVTDVAGMKDLQFGFQATTTGGDYIQDTIKPNKQPREFSTLGAATQTLANGQIDAFVTDTAIGAEIVKERGEDIAMTGQFETKEKYGAPVREGKPAPQPAQPGDRGVEDERHAREAPGQVVPGLGGPAYAAVAAV